jgi:hypothetical protein
MRAVVVLAILGLSSSAFAQAPGITAPLSYEPVSYPQPVVEEKSGAVAATLSLGATLGSFALLRSNPGLGVVGLLVGPSVGRWYNHEIGGIGIAARVLSAGLIFDGITALDEESDCDEPCSAPDHSSGERKLYLGLALWAGSTLYDFVEAGRGAERYNSRLRIAPTIVSTGRQSTMGLGVGLSF